MPYGSALMGILGAGGGNNLVTTLYSGNGAIRSIVTGQDADIVWIANRDGGNNVIFDTTRGATKYVIGNTTQMEFTDASSLTAFNSNGFSLGTDATVNRSGDDYVAWGFKQGYCAVVTYNGDATTPRAIAHGLGVTPNVMMIFPRTSNFSDLSRMVYHSSLGNTKYLILDDNGAAATDAGKWANTSPTSTHFTVGADDNVNNSNSTYVAFLFANDVSRKFKVGTFTTDSSGNATITGVGFRPKLIDLKRTDAAGDWHRLDEKRGFDKQLTLNNATAETTVSYMAATSDGFTLTGYTASATGIFLAAG